MSDSLENPFQDSLDSPQAPPLDGLSSHAAPLTGGLSVRVSLSRPAVPINAYADEPLHAVIEIEPQAVTISGEARAPLNLVLVVDASGTMHHFQLTEEEREYWLGLAISRDEMERGEADNSDAVYWTGQTLTEMQSIARKPMALVCDALKNLLVTLLPTDRACVIAFADTVHTVFAASDWLTFPDQCLLQLDALREQRLPVDIGTGTHMAASLLAARDALQSNSLPGGINRLLIISDGIVQDPDETLVNLLAIQDEGFAITTIGVGDEFDEEFLMRVADNSRGEYCYAADVAEITDCLHQELTTLQATAVTDLYIAVRGMDGAVVQDVSLVRPSMALFDELFTEEGWQRARVGDVSSAAPAGILLQIAPPLLPEGDHTLAEVLLTWSHTGAGPGAGTAKAGVIVNATDDPTLLSQSHPEVVDLVKRASIYRYERDAQRAQERGDTERAREKLGAATRELYNIGEDALASEMEMQMDALGKASADPTRAKRIKATTRRLGSAPAMGNTRRLGAAPVAEAAEPSVAD